jgi:predicted transcriptional regulator
LRATPESVVHDLFRRHHNYFGALEEAARGFRAGETIAPDEVYSDLKRRLRADFGIEVEQVSVSDLPGTLRLYDQKARKILLSQGLDYPNKVFQLTHVAGLIGYRALIDRLIEANGLAGEARDLARCRVELANYFAAAVLMPYEDILAAALHSGYDIDHLAARFGVSFEQACQRVTTLQRDGAKGVPFFFLRVDRAGNVTKRFNAMPIHLAEYGGGCPRWDVHQCFRVPGRTLPQFVEMPDGSRYFTINRTVDRPALGHESQDHRLAITLGCSIEHAPRIVYAAQFQMNQPASSRRSASTAACARATIARSAPISPSSSTCPSTSAGAARRASRARACCVYKETQHGLILMKSHAFREKPVSTFSQHALASSRQLDTGWHARCARTKSSLTRVRRLAE